MLDISAIILTYNEELHIKRCIENISPIVKQIFIVDSFSSDRTIEIVKESGAEVYQNKWENNHAKQFNWALENLPIRTKWVLRLDADEYLTEELIRELEARLPSLPEDITGVVFKLHRFFLGRQIKRGTRSVKLLRLFQHRKATCEQRWMDEHMELTEGQSVEFKHAFADHNLHDLNWWTNKHNGYAIRETIDLLDIEFNLLDKKSGNKQDKQEAGKRNKKLSYARYPLLFRSFAYFAYRYFFQLGFLEGKEGFLWHFLQGWWYRTLVDGNILEIKKSCGNDVVKIKNFIKENYKIDLTK